jgi:hypothetical protein
MKKPTYKDLERKVKELEAQSATNLKAALRDLCKADNRLMASACIIQIEALGGREIVAPFAIRDGLSAETIAAIKLDIYRSMELSGFKQ